jgi:hypothetical protein
VSDGVSIVRVGQDDRYPVDRAEQYADGVRGGLGSVGR